MAGTTRVMRALHQWKTVYAEWPVRLSVIFAGVLAFYFLVVHALGII